MPEQSAFTARLVRIDHALFLTGALVHLILVCIQPFLAGWSLDGDGNAFDWHGVNGSIILTISMILIPVSVLWWRPGRGTPWAPALVVLLFAAETFQLGMGYADILVVHIPLGVGIVLGSFVLFGLTLVRRRRTVASGPQRRTVS
ncbi:hypothetical protein FB384_000567 [Prauserella sediminis]|uniref:Uncharacterized protein n=1 Tax=Prauserella sediminis TaxID=577680 RepID=A0A839XLP6_9PSEU|nr:hypothetical protein [Prauserella sediminis]MBB3661663.1 hypothetical protein [Prauserella sediminis]